MVESIMIKAIVTNNKQEIIQMAAREAGGRGGRLDKPLFAG
jgi:hypothetical protein